MLRCKSSETGPGGGGYKPSMFCLNAIYMIERVNSFS